MSFTNLTKIPLPMAVWLVNDEYDGSALHNYISVTTLIKPLRFIVLSKRLAKLPLEKSGDISSLINSRIGTAIHNGVETAWVNSYEKCLLSLGYSKKAILTIRVNPVVVAEGTIPVYLEQRVQKEIAGYVIGGKYDIIADGKLYDIKTTSTYTYINNTNEHNYRLQGSMYRWLNQDKIHDPFIYINYLFTDWSALSAKLDSKYPQSRILEFPVSLLGVQETEHYIRTKLNQLTALANTPEPDLPECSDEELWRSSGEYKYYSDPTKLTRASKNFGLDGAQANQYKSSKGKGVVLFKPGQVKACKYCSVFKYCTQKDKYIADGSLSL